MVLRLVIGHTHDYTSSAAAIVPGSGNHPKILRPETQPIVLLQVQDHGAVAWADPYSTGGPLAENNIGTSRRSMSRILWRRGSWEKEESKMEVGVVLAPDGAYGSAGEGGVVESDGADADDKDGGQGEDDLMAVIKLNVADVIAGGRARRSSSCSTHLCCRPGTNFLSETGDQMKLAWFFGVRGESASQRDSGPIAGIENTHLGNEENVGSRDKHDGVDQDIVIRQASCRKGRKGTILENPTDIDGDEEGERMAGVRYRPGRSQAKVFSFTSMKPNYHAAFSRRIEWSAPTLTFLIQNRRAVLADTEDRKKPYWSPTMNPVIEVIQRVNRSQIDEVAPRRDLFPCLQSNVIVVWRVLILGCADRDTARSITSERTLFQHRLEESDASVTGITDDHRRDCCLVEQAAIVTISQAGQEKLPSDLNTGTKSGQTPKALSFPGVRMQLIILSTLFALSSYSVAVQDQIHCPPWIVKIPSLPDNENQSITPSPETPDDHIGITNAAIEKAIGMLNCNAQFPNNADGDFGAAATLYGQIAEFDRLTKQTLYKDSVSRYFENAKLMKSDFLYKQNYGYAAARAYAAYQNESFLDLAKTSWASARQYTISLEQAISGTIDTKQFNLSSCNGTLAGGTYFDTDENTPFLSSLASGIGSSANPSSSCQVKDSLSPQGSGAFIEGLGILAGIPPHNSSMESLLNSTIYAVTTDSLWYGADGVYNNNDDGGHYIVRAVASFYERNKTSSDLRDHISKYIRAQYNSVRNNATSSKSNIYGLSWTGPPSTSFDGVNQTSALTVLLSAILLDEQPSFDSSDNSTSSAIPTSSVGTSLLPQPSMTSSVNPDNPIRSASSAQKNSAGIIAGSVIGRMALLAGLIIVGLFFRKLHRQRSDVTSVVDASSLRVTPFPMTQNMASSGILGEQHRRNRLKPARFPEAAIGREPSSLRAADNGLVGIPRVNVRTEPAASPGTQDALSPENPPPGDGRGRILLEELLRSLNARISPDRWNAEEVPPDYHEGYAM
ncbi:hypothetical protein F5146DRAFT_1199177 [Armillaria mellea]|nr:hypothetical protein F5146DRAFT_1199177 [Armillaria mellea]